MKKNQNKPEQNAGVPESGEQTAENGARAYGRAPAPRAPELNAKASEARVEPHNIDPEKALAHAERRAARQVQDEELAALANLALIRSGMIGGRRDRLRDDFGAERPRNLSNEEWRQELQRIIDEAER